MRWESGRRSTNVEDRRQFRVSRAAAGGGIGVIVMALIAIYLGVDPAVILNSGTLTGGSPPHYEAPAAGPAPDDQLADFVSVVLADTEDTWHELFQQMGKSYREPSLVLFSGAAQSACGFAQAAVGPFYCPADQKVYIDLSFYRDLKHRHQSPGDFAQAYVIAHEIGHHVQTLLGITQQIDALRYRVSEAEANQLSVRLELQADCFAGVWAYHANRARQILEAGDIEEALNAASNIGDDRLQQQSMGYVVPDSFTHGSSAQRVHWFKRGLAGGHLGQCNTFESGAL